MTSIEQVFAGRTMALDRASLPGLARVAAMKLGDGSAVPSHAAMGGGRGTELAVQQIGSTAVIPLTGVITSDPFLTWLFGGTSPDALVSAIQSAVADPAITGIVLLTDSPGGEVGLVTEAAAAIRVARAVKPIVAIARPMMASGAYWLACQASTIVATPSALVGAVGVFMVHYDESALNARIGVAPTYIASDARKVEGNPDEPLGDDARAFLQARIDQTYGIFVQDIALGRRTSTTAVRANFGGGRAFGADEAKKRGMVDRVATLDSLFLQGGQRGLSASAADHQRMIFHALERDAAFDLAVSDEAAIIAALSDESW